MSEVVLPWFIVKKTLPLLETAAMILIWGSLSALETSILFLAWAQPLRRWSVLRMILSSMLKTSLPAFKTLMYS